MTEHRSRFRSADPPEESATDRRNHYRIDSAVSMRVRRAADVATQRPDAAADPVAAFEEMASAAARYRKELTGAGRQFVDRLVATMDAVVGELSKAGSSAGWSPKFVAEANISAGGIGFEAERHWSVEEEVEVEFAVLGEQSSVPFRAQGIVRRCAALEEGGYAIGIEFEEMAATTRERLIRLVFDLQRVQLRSRKAR